MKEVIVKLKNGMEVGYGKEIILCKDCCHWKPPHIRLNDGKQRAYKKAIKKIRSESAYQRMSV